MARKKKGSSRKKTIQPSGSPAGTTDHRALVERASEFAVKGESAEAIRLCQQAEDTTKDPIVRALASNSIGVLAAMNGDYDAAEQRFQSALAIDPGCSLARDNLALLQSDEAAIAAIIPRIPGVSLAPPTPAFRPTRVAILSFLFNWPSTGGGNVHTAELALFLGRAGYDVRHFYARYAPWGIGNVYGTPYPCHALNFEENDWNLANIQAVFRRAVDDYSPDHVIITDSWNIKPHLAEAVRGYSYFLRFQAMECLCPLNNVRLLPEPDGRAKQCPLHQLASVCRKNGKAPDRPGFLNKLFNED